MSKPGWMKPVRGQPKADGLNRTFYEAIKPDSSLETTQITSGFLLI